MTLRLRDGRTVHVRVGQYVTYDVNGRPIRVTESHPGSWMTAVCQLTRAGLVRV